MSSFDFAEFANFDDFSVEEPKEIIVSTQNSYTVNTDFIKTAGDAIFDIDIEYLSQVPDDLVSYVIDANFHLISTTTPN